MSNPWVAPDAPAEVAPPMPAMATLDEPAVAVGAPELPIPLRAMTMADRLDGSLRILKLAPGPVVAIAAVAVVPVQLLAAVALRGVPSEPQLEAIVGKAATAVLLEDVSSIGIAVVMLVVEAFSLSFVTAAIADLVAGWYLGQRRDTGEVIARAARRLPTLAAAWLLVHLVEGVFSLVFVVGALVPMAWFAVVVPVIGVEGVGAWRAMGRSFSLTKRAFAPTALMCVLVAVVDLLLRIALTAISLLFGELPAGWAVAAVFNTASRLVTVPFVAGCATLLYLDLRVRLEGLDIELAAADRFPLAE